MDLSYFAKINNFNGSTSKQNTENYLINRYETQHLYDNVDKVSCTKNGAPFECLMIKGGDGYTKKVKAIHETPFNLGDYLAYDGKTYLVTSLDVDDKNHHSGEAKLCTLKLTWQKPNGDICSRWTFIEDLDRYSDGIIANGVITIATGKYGCTLPVDEDTITIGLGRRFVVDFVTPDMMVGDIVPDVYVVNGFKKMLSNLSVKNRGAVMTLVMKYDGFNATTDRWVSDSIGWICDYITPQTPTPAPSSTVFATIVGSNEIRNKKRTWKVEFKNQSGEELSTFSDFTWQLVYDTSDQFVTMTSGTTIYSVGLQCSSTDVGKQFTLAIKQTSTQSVLASIRIEVVGF